MIGMVTTEKTVKTHGGPRLTGILTHDVSDDIQCRDQALQRGVQPVRDIGETFHWPCC